jgi:aspartyl-tRNA synthetase
MPSGTTAGCCSSICGTGAASCRSCSARKSPPPQVCHRQAALLRAEYCIAVTGQVKQRLAGTENPNIATGTIEVLVTQLTVLAESDSLPFPISDKAMVAGAASAGADVVGEDLRLQYRYLDIRRPSMQDHLRARHRIFQCIRQFLDSRGFVEVETPVLTASTPEGARDYLVPSRVHPRNFYALPQSPQLFKQLLMVGGMERYFQLARCFRDEDLRPNRQPEFTQLDLEASFIDEEFLYELIEELTVKMFAVGGIPLSRPFARMTYAEAMDTTGSDCPDLRFGLRFVDVTDVFSETNYSIFRQILQRGGCIKGINIPGQSDKLSKNVLQNEYAKQIAPSFGAKGMTWMRAEGGKLESNIVQFFSSRELEVARPILGCRRRRADHDRRSVLRRGHVGAGPVASASGQTAGADPRRYLPSGLGHGFSAVRGDRGRRRHLQPPSVHRAGPHGFRSEERGRAADAAIAGLRSGGQRRGTGGRQHPYQHRDVQRKVFTALGLSEDEIQERFGFFLRALDFGAPPHGGLALGMDRTVSMILQTPSIREVIAFPKNRSAACPLTRAPSMVKSEQLAELGLLNLGGTEVLRGTAEKEDRIDHLSWVSRIGVTDDERPMLEEVLARAEALAALAEQQAGTEEPIFTVVPTANRMRPGREERRSVLSEQGRLRDSSPSVKGDYYKVASVLE